MLRDLLPLVLWGVLWVAGGWSLALHLFRLRRAEAAMVGVGIGLVLQLWLANLLARFAGVPLGFWLAALLVAASGGAAAMWIRRHGPFQIGLEAWLGLAALSLLFFLIGRGLAVFDDYQNLPTVSLMGAGDVPPHFALNPTVRFGYHYALLLFAAEFFRIGHMFPWTALDLARGVSLALPLLLTGLWTYRFTKNRLSALLSAFLLMFAGGSRWLLLLLPAGMLQRISDSITLIGSAAQSAPNLEDAMVSAWKIDGAGPLPFPFAFHSGVNQSYVMAYTGIAGTGILIVLLLLLTVTRWKHWAASAVTILLLATLAMANEIMYLLLGLGFVMGSLVWWLGGRSRIGVRTWSRALMIIAAASILSVVQGGMLTEMAHGLIERSAAAASYFDTSPVFSWPPAIISAHLGALSILNPWQLIAGLVEIGPLVLITPLVWTWARKSFQECAWTQSLLILGSAGAGVSLFVSFRGPLFTATPRLMSVWFLVCSLYAVPLLWKILPGRSDWLAVTALVSGFAATLGGVVLFGTQLPAIQRPVYATFITPMDAKMSQQLWNALAPGELIFDPVVFRAPTVFGRFTMSSPSWYTRLDSWQALSENPSPESLHAAGFGYAYFDGDYWDALAPQVRALFSVDCVKQVAEVDGIHGPNDYTKDFRRLLDIRTCP